MNVPWFWKATMGPWGRMQAEAAGVAIGSAGGQDVVQLGGIQGQRAPAIPADASTLLEETEALVRPPLPLKPEKKQPER